MDEYLDVCKSMLTCALKINPYRHARDSHSLGLQ